jgi:hypothetical protein
MFDVDFVNDVLLSPDGMYLITDDGVIDYAERWGYGYIVGIKPMAITDDVDGGKLFGIWTDENGQRHYDLVKHVDSLPDAIKLGKETNQRCIYGLRDQEVVHI